MNSINYIKSRISPKRASMLHTAKEKNINTRKSRNITESVICIKLTKQECLVNLIICSITFAF